MELSISCIKDEMRQFAEVFDQMLRTRVPLADEVIRYFLDRKGKQMRPVLTLLTAKMLREEVSRESIYGAVAVELLHNASLMHDDVVDHSEERRGAPTVNKVWDNRVAVLTGDFFLAKCLTSSNAIGSLAISRILGEMVIALAEGELEQLSNVRSRMLSEDAYFSVIRGKTASLFSACLRIGAHSVNASPEEIEKLGEIGEKMGLVFQIRDDIFDYYPQSEDVGKPSGHDIMEGKVTLPLLYALQHAPAEEARRMRAILEQNRTLTPEQVAAMVEFARQMGGIEYAQAKMKNIAFEAKKMLRTFPDNEARQTLCNVIDYFISREK